LDETLLTERLELICEKEGIKATKESLKEMMNISSGDMRRAITLLQSSKMMFGKEIEAKHVLMISGVRKKKIKKLTRSFQKNSLKDFTRVLLLKVMKS
jgi:DNA polymerase III delta prime subunit